MGEKSIKKPFVAVSTKSEEKVNHPSHYINSDGKECIDVMIDTFGIDAVITFCKLNAFKYMFRAGKKEGSPEKEDLDKAAWYTNYMLNLLQQGK